ncbi:MAG: hypothetical protein ABIJ21_06705 [Nanoarchaeota archaeon]
MDWLCQEHNLDKAGLCEWCSRPICEECIDEAAGKKYCMSCTGRLPFHELGHINRSIASRGRENVDPTLTEEELEEGKEYVQKTVSGRKAEAKGIRNVSGDSADLRKKREEYEKMRRKFDI